MFKLFFSPYTHCFAPCFFCLIKHPEDSVRMILTKHVWKVREIPWWITNMIKNWKECFNTAPPPLRYFKPTAFWRAGRRGIGGHRWDGHWLERGLTFRGASLGLSALPLVLWSSPHPPPHKVGQLERCRLERAGGRAVHAEWEGTILGPHWDAICNRRFSELQEILKIILSNSFISQMGKLSPEGNKRSLPKVT